MAVAVNQKQVVARGSVIWRGIFIFETKYGCEFFIGFKKYTKKTLEEATAFIDWKLGGSRVS